MRMPMSNSSDIYISDRFAGDRLKMVETIKTYGVVNDRILNIMNSIPRHLFLPNDAGNSESYGDYPIDIGFGQTISQPYMVAYMTKCLDIRDTDKILEIGTGSGYQTAILALLCSHVYTIEIVPELLSHAIKIIEMLGINNVSFHRANGYDGLDADQSFDKILVACAPESIPENLICQLANNGEMILPVGKFNQLLYIITKKDGRITQKEDIDVRFVPMIKN